MATILYKWLGLVYCAGMLMNAIHHPIFVSVTEINHNSKAQQLEISCKIFTDDLEQTLRAQNKQKIDLLNPAVKAAMEPLVRKYVQQHLQLNVNGKPVVLDYVGYEQQEEGIVSYWEVDKVAALQQLTVTDNILYESKPQQIELIHVIVNGQRQSTKLANPDAVARFNF